MNKYLRAHKVRTTVNKNRKKIMARRRVKMVMGFKLCKTVRMTREMALSIKRVVAQSMIESTRNSTN